MKKAIIKYYIPFVYAALLAIIPVGYFNYENDRFLELTIILIILLFTITVLFGTFNLLFGEKLKNRLRRKDIKKEKLQKFKSIGFYEKDNKLLGKVDNYFSVISLDQNIFNGIKWVEIQILFNPKMNSQYIPEYLFDKLMSQSDKSVIWHSNTVFIRKNYSYRVPKYETLLEMIKRTTKLLISNNVNTIDYKEWTLTINDSKTHFKQISGLKK